MLKALPAALTGPAEMRLVQLVGWLVGWLLVKLRDDFWHYTWRQLVMIGWTLVGCSVGAGWLGQLIGILARPKECIAAEVDTHRCGGDAHCSCARPCCGVDGCCNDDSFGDVVQGDGSCHDWAKRCELRTRVGVVCVKAWCAMSVV